jgi:hypothetical protein
MSNSFYVIVPSNAPGFPNNKTNKFKVHLPKSGVPSPPHDQIFQTFHLPVAKLDPFPNLLPAALRPEKVGQSLTFSPNFPFCSAGRIFHFPF